MPSPWRAIRKEIEDGTHATHYLLMCSGGVDSQFMLDFFRRCECAFSVVHFQHHIRPDDHKDRAAVESTLVGLDNTYYLGYGHGLNSGTNVEARAREQRYKFVEEIIDSQRDVWKKGFVTAVTGHHYNDWIESCFMDLARGKPHNNLGMTKWSTFSTHYRYKPFLEVPKSEILKQAKARKLNWVEDPTNQINDCDRNIWRNEIIPMLNQRRNLESAMAGQVK